MEQVILDHCSPRAIDPVYNISGTAGNIIQADHLYSDSRLVENPNINRSGDHCSPGALDPVYNISGNTGNIIRADYCSSGAINGCKSLFGLYPNFLFPIDEHYQKTEYFVSISYHTIINGIKEGILYREYKLGGIMSLGRYENGKLNGPWKFWRDGEILHEAGYYKDGEKEGETIIYYRNGKIKIKGKFKKGKASGLWKYYNKNGKRKGFIYDLMKWGRRKIFYC